ncbi:nucleotide sugar dehydrogenase [Cohnella sp. LGH]|uniref:UDP-N-acetyl-D-galactosamine dehydrogenase n=1 Tax=Cohnella phaseoli TaxID=456490 RepID=A0A3D9I085_9BACL|nr:MULTISPECIES: nucleotide sugar dehydrogenase [Cohnella]QTH44780.1 nucleotide sugar dehydrogenase [Cohnella sp. LGH]RED55164.1 UDP-N-acetyl-D-galactosamine dehydrogenase [Cohnella phaseoli]
MNIYDRLLDRMESIAVVGLGYVGLPLALAFAKKVNVVGFDLNKKKIEGYRNGLDATDDVGDEAVRNSTASFTSDVSRLEDVHFYIVAVPTPIGSGNVPDLTYIENASRLVGSKLSKGAIVVFESTVYPGVTEEICVPILEAESGLRCGEDFKVGYSPERINPGDKVHRLENIIKIVSGMDTETLETIAKVYELIIEAGVYRAESIKVAEAAKVIENAQRDVNIAFMNELAMLFKQMNIPTRAVLEAAKTKWNFLPFEPGLVGGHCIGIDPYYLTYKAEDTGYRSRIILAGRHINDGMGSFVAQSIVKMLVKLKVDISSARIGFLGLTYKENCSDIRNTKVIDVIHELNEYGITPLVTDPMVDPEQAFEEYGIELMNMEHLQQLDAVVVAVPHSSFASMTARDFEAMFAKNKTKVLVDVKGVFNKSDFEKNGFHYWSL